jgi:transcriptional regulator with XRE-family HTH domain
MFWKNLCRLCNDNQTTPNTVCKELKLSSATATHWKNGAVPRDTTLQLIADYFSTTPEALLRDPDEQPAPEPVTTSPLSDEFNKLLEQMTLTDLKDLQAFMLEKINNRK